MAASEGQKARMYDVHLQVQQTLDLLLPDARARGLEWNDITQSLYDLERAIADFGNTPEVTLIGDSINNAQVLLLLNNALPDALHEIKQHFDRSHSARTEVTHESARVASHAYFEVFESFAFGCRSATALINNLCEISQDPRRKSSSSWYRANEAQWSLRQVVTDKAIWPPSPQSMRKLAPLKSEYVLGSQYGVWTPGTILLQKLETSWQEAGYGGLSESNKAICDLRHALFWASVSKTKLRGLQNGQRPTLNTNVAPALQRVVVIVEFILSAIKSIWLLDRLELTTAYGWFPRKIRDLNAMVLHRLAEDLELFCSLGMQLPSAADINRFGEFSFKMPIRLVEQVSSGLKPESHNIRLEDRRPIQQPHHSVVQNVHGPSSRGGSREQPQSTQGTITSDMFRITDAMEGLQVAHAENNPALPESAIRSSTSNDTTSATHEEIEMPNLEFSESERPTHGFQTGVLSFDPMPPLNELGYVKSHVSVFKRFSGPESYVRVQTRREDAPTNDFKALLQLTELVPSYVFSEDEDHERPLFLRSAGISLGLIFKVKCTDDMGQPHFKELYGLQGALIGAKFEVQYSAQSILLHRKGAEAERLRPIKIQIWQDAKELNSAPDPATISRRDSSGPVSPRHREIPLDSSESDIEEAKIYLFSQNCIYVLFISDRIVATKQTAPKKIVSRSLPTTLFLTPNKSKGVNSIRVRVIEGTSRIPAGISLDPSSFRFSDQDTPAYTDFQSIQIEFATKDIMVDCFDEIQDCIAERIRQCSRAENFKKLERNVRLHWKSKFTKGPQPAPTFRVL